MSERVQLDVVWRLLIDEEAKDPRWVIDWAASELAPGEQRLLAEMEARFSRAPAKEARILCRTVLAEPAAGLGMSLRRASRLVG